VGVWVICTVPLEWEWRAEPPSEQLTPTNPAWAHSLELFPDANKGSVTIWVARADDAKPLKEHLHIHVTATKPSAHLSLEVELPAQFLATATGRRRQ